MATEEELQAKKDEVRTKRGDIRVVESVINQARIASRDLPNKAAMRSSVAGKKEALDAQRQNTRDKRKAFAADSKVLDEAIEAEVAISNAAELTDLVNKRLELRTLRSEFRAMKRE